MNRQTLPPLTVRAVKLVGELFQQMIKGNWKDDHGHPTVNNQATLNLVRYINEISLLRTSQNPNLNINAVTVDDTTGKFIYDTGMDVVLDDRVQFLHKKMIDVINKWVDSEDSRSELILAINQAFETPTPVVTATPIQKLNAITQYPEAKPYELTRDEFLSLSPYYQAKYSRAVALCRNKDAAGPFGGWADGHKLLKEMGWIESRDTQGFRAFITVVKPASVDHLKGDNYHDTQ